jgi:hypothetical protein
MSDPIDDLQSRIDAADAEGERVCAELKSQLDTARALVKEARRVLTDAEHATDNEPRSFPPEARPN